MMISRKENLVIRLENIVRNSDVIQCKILPEDSKEYGELKVNLSAESFEYTLPKGYDWCESHVYHAKCALIEMAKSNTIVNEKTIIWY